MAFAGFENLTFIACEFRKPRRDFPLAMSIAFLLATLVSIGLKILYPLVVFLLALSASITREPGRISHLRKEAPCRREKTRQEDERMEHDEARRDPVREQNGLRQCVK